VASAPSRGRPPRSRSASALVSESGTEPPRGQRGLERLARGRRTRMAAASSPQAGAAPLRRRGTERVSGAVQLGERVPRTRRARSPSGRRRTSRRCATDAGTAPRGRTRAGARRLRQQRREEEHLAFRRQAGGEPRPTARGPARPASAAPEERRDPGPRGRRGRSDPGDSTPARSPRPRVRGRYLRTTSARRRTFGASAASTVRIAGRDLDVVRGVRGDARRAVVRRDHLAALVEHLDGEVDLELSASCGCRSGTPLDARLVVGFSRRALSTS
jgi:hypothetical protein